MGANGSKQRHGSPFSSKEMAELEKIFNQLSSRNNHKYFHRHNLKAQLPSFFPEQFVVVIHEQMVQNSPGKNENIEFPVFVAAMTQFLKGSSADRARILHRLATAVDTESVLAVDMFRLIFIMTGIFMRIISETSEYLSWEDALDIKDNNRFIHFLLRDLFFPEQNNKHFHNDNIPEAAYSAEQLEKWLNKNPLIFKMMDIIFHTCFPVVECPCAFPQMLSTKKSQSILDPATVMALNSHLPKSYQIGWKRLYSMSADGESFSIMINQINEQGPSIIVVEDDEGFIFGSFLSEPWEINANFRGTPACFVFSVFPILKIYSATGYNDHFMYLNQNQQTLPNGLGIGGQFHYFGIWLDSNFGRGSCSRTCTTFNSPQLSSKPDFKLANLEVWGVASGGSVTEDWERGVQRSSVLDRNVEAKAMLEMIGRGPVSEGLREPEPTPENPRKNWIQTFPYENNA